MRTPLVIVGAGGFGREVLDLVLDIEEATPTYELLGFLDDGEGAAEQLSSLGFPLLGPTSALATIDAQYVVGIASVNARRRIAALARDAGRSGAILRHPQATVSRHAHLGEGAIIAAGARLATNVRLGVHVHVNMNTTIGHDSVLEDHVTVFGGVTVGGGCRIMEAATVGSGSVIVPRVRIGRGALIGAGAIVTRDVEDGVVVVGTSARPSIRSDRQTER